MPLQDTIKKFQQLPQNIQQALSSDEAMAKMEALEGKYNLKLASFVLRAAVREFPLEDLGIVIRKELNLKPEQAGILKDELLDQIFAPVLNYYANKNIDSPVNELTGSRVQSPNSLTRELVNPEINNNQPARPPIAPPRPPSPQPSPRTLPPQPPKSRSYFYFDAEDEKDVEKFKKHEVVASGRGKEFIERIDKTADEVINRSLVKMPDENSKKRLKSYLTAYFRGIRDTLQTKESLAKPFVNGGMEFDAMSIEKIMALAKDEFRKIHSVSAERKNESGIMNQESSGVEEKKMESVEKKDEASIKNPAEGDNNQERQPPPQTTNYQLPTTSQTNIRRERPQVIDTDKPKIAEVRLPSKLTGPLEEIEQISLRDLRRFAQNHQGFSDRTMERIKILENESFEKRMMGIAAWRKSLLYQQYLNVIQNSLEKNTSIPEMIGAIDEAQSSNMSFREWQTVNKLNRELKT